QGDLKGFLGCCNPTHIVITLKGEFVTAEKGVVRVKIYGPDGVFKCVVAPPSLFEEGAVITDLRVGLGGCVLVLDSKSTFLRVFRRK
ncbi:MAG: hypothetical protein KAG97_13450, partial [Victivallales bacterium]|nr:hypothetical protein [Victivallales bacterium]